LPTPIIIKAKHAVGQIVFASYFNSVIKSDKSSLLFLDYHTRRYSSLPPWFLQFSTDAK
jgi:hypothetical protein